MKKPSIPFLRKVKAGEVRSTFGYTMRRGGHHGFRGGEASYRKHLSAGYVRPVGVAELGRPAVVELTEAGERALAEAEASS